LLLLLLLLLLMMLLVVVVFVDIDASIDLDVNALFLLAILSNWTLLSRGAMLITLVGSRRRSSIGKRANRCSINIFIIFIVAIVDVVIVDMIVIIITILVDYVMLDKNRYSFGLSIDVILRSARSQTLCFTTTGYSYSVY
jgi:hypothetical protein